MKALESIGFVMVGGRIAKSPGVSSSLAGTLLADP
jgi:hypothetical protein